MLSFKQGQKIIFSSLVAVSYGRNSPKFSSPC